MDGSGARCRRSSPADGVLHLHEVANLLARVALVQSQYGQRARDARHDDAAIELRVELQLRQLAPFVCDFNTGGTWRKREKRERPTR